MFAWSACGGVYPSDGTPASIQSQYNAATTAGSGNTVTIPSGNFASSANFEFTNNNWVILQGQGAGKVLGNSTTTLAIGTGSKSWATQSGLPITVGQTLTVERVGGTVSGGVASLPIPSMTGTVTVYSGNTLTLNVTTVNGSGTHPEWIISSQPSTVISNMVVTGSLIDLYESTSGHNEISGIRFISGANVDGAHINVHRVSSGKAVLLHDNYFYLNASITGINLNANRGVFWSNSFVFAPFSNARLAVHLQGGPNDSWNTLSTMGTNDLTGESNLYGEDCDFHAAINWGDWDDNGRTVTRYSWFDEAGTGTHGADTSNYGTRHYEFYKNRGTFHGYGDGNTLNLNWWFLLRGGTGRCWSNDFPIINSSDYGLRPTWNLAVFNLHDPGGPHGCWGAGTTGGADYPAPRQAGLGNVTGASTPADAFAYLGASEPMYYWSNSNAGGGSFGWRNGSGACVAPDTSVNYIVQNRDFFTNTAAPNYAPYTYPHPLRGTNTPPSPSSRIARATNVHINNAHVGP